MNHLQSLIQQGESEHLEFKASFGKEAFAEIYHHEDKTIIGLSVISYPIKPISFKGKYYKRVHNANHLMDLNEIANEHLKTINLSWDFARDPSHDINDISLKKVNRFIENSLIITDLGVLNANKSPFGKGGNVCDQLFILLLTDPTFQASVIDIPLG